MKKFSLNYLYLMVWVACVLYASLSSSSPDTPLFEIPHFDKFIHFGMYFGFAFLLIPIQLGTTKRINTYAFAIAVLFGLFLELVQYLMHTGRDASLYDAIANTFGAFTGILVYRKLIEGTKLQKIIFRN